MSKHAFAPGFRFSRLDGFVLFAGTALAIALSLAVWWWGFVLGHFFLFCNLVRMSRPLELVWSAVFVALASATIALEFPGWAATACFSLLATLVLVLLELGKPSYHGVAWQWVNPGLPAWWARQDS